MSKLYELTTFSISCSLSFGVNFRLELGVNEIINGILLNDRAIAHLDPGRVPGKISHFPVSALTILA
jgi:hypothetical protein